MTKTKKIFFFAATFLFLSIFFVKIDHVWAMSCSELCSGDAACISECVASNGDNSNWNVDTQSLDTCAGSYPGSLEDRSGQCYCPSGYDWSPSGDSCVYIDTVPDSIDQNYVKSGLPTTTTQGCDPNPSCMFWNCCSSSSSAATPATVDKKASNEAASAATAATSVQNAAAQRVNNEIKQQDMICKTAGADACAVATQSLNEAKAAYDKATADAQNAIASANALSGNSSSGAGYMLCANGMYATVCDGNFGTPYTIGIGGGFSSGGYSGGTTSGYMGGVSKPKCENGFQDIGGVCFPSNTGLSNAPIQMIVTNLFSWLMVLFTTLAVLAFVVAGIQYLLASADEDLAKAAKGNAKNAAIGIIVGLSGFIIIKAIAAALSGQSIFF